MTARPSPTEQALAGLEATLDAAGRVNVGVQVMTPEAARRLLELAGDE